ncbi:MAG: hypothetical protein K9L82_11060 [Chromatiaceae bacterium]|nr:hypothetical protein [Chromatiaceae bacterium]MCF7995403.1 hypothetical protein [Chromatiaceae bacterium]MCF8014992.1 hypothetical protein [Chromatiaceae bacterium]
MKSATASIRQQVELRIGKAGTRVGQLIYVRQGRRENTALAYAESWLSEVYVAVSNWRQIALSPEVGLRPAELDDFAPAFEHDQTESAAVLLRQ